MLEVTWGDTVIIKKDAPVAMRPGEIAAVVGIRKILDIAQAEKFAVCIGDTVVLIEFGDGASVEVGENMIEKIC